MDAHFRRQLASAPRRGEEAALSPKAIVLLVLAALVVALGFGRLSDALLDIGVLLVGVFLAVAARICQARDQHRALCRVLDEGHPPRRY